MTNSILRFSLRRLAVVLPVITGSLLMTLQARAEVVIKDGDRVAFLGDSITQGGWGNPGGYVRLIIAGLEANGIKTTPIPAGISGHKSNQMLERLKRDVLDKKPTWMTLSCGVNDVWHGLKGVPLPQYETNITAIVDQCQAAGVKVMILTATVIGEDLTNANNTVLALYNDFLRSLAKEKKCPLADLNATFQQVIKGSAKPGRVLTSDGVHMNPTGDQLMARGVLQGFGLDEAQLKKAEEAWLDLPNGVALNASYVAGKGKTFRASCQVTIRQKKELDAAAAKEGSTLAELLNEGFAKDAKELLKPTGQYDSFEEIFRLKKEGEASATLKGKLEQRVAALLKK